MRHEAGRGGVLGARASARLRLRVRAVLDFQSLSSLLLL
jgi:hypothetical protein